MTGLGPEPRLPLTCLCAFLLWRTDLKPYLGKGLGAGLFYLFLIYT